MRRKATFVLFLYIVLFLCIAFAVLAASTGEDKYRTEVSDQKGIKISIIYPARLQPGSSILIGLEAGIEKNELKAEFDGKEEPIFSIEEKMFCLAGVDVRKPGGIYKFLLYQKTEDGAWQKFFEELMVLKPLKTKIVNVGKAPKRSEEFLERYKKERETIKEALNKSSSSVLFKEPFAMPLQEITITSGFGTRRAYSSPKYTSTHSGVDLEAPTGTEVRSVNDGKVLLAQEFTLEGNFVVVDHGSKIISSYMHLQDIKVKEGEAVKRGDIIGFAGSTGNCRGAHLHFGIRINEENIDPLEFIEMVNQFLFATSAAY